MDIRSFCAVAAIAATLSVAAANNPYGSCAHVTRGEPAARTCAMMRQAGMGWVRSDFDWRSIEKKKGEWDFSYFDRVVAECEAEGVQLLPILGYSVPWAHPAHAHLDAWEEYVRKVVTHYGKRLPVLEVWNEENVSGFWKDPNPTNYLAVLRRTYETAKKIDPTVRVAFGGTAGVPFGFIEEVYRLGGAKWFDIMNIHPYSHPRRPEGAVDAQIEKLRVIMARYGDAQKPIWITAAGWPTHSARTSADGTGSEERQSNMAARALGIAFAEGIENFFWHEFRQPDRDPYDPESDFGMVHGNFAPKPAYGAFMTFVDARPAGSVQTAVNWRSADGTVYFPQWTRPDKRTAGMIWSTKAAHARKLAFTSSKVTFLDVAGARVRPACEGSVYTLTLSGSPIYFIGGALKEVP